MTLAAVAPGLFSANNTGRGLAAAMVDRVHADGTASLESANTAIDVSNGSGGAGVVWDGDSGTEIAGGCAGVGGWNSGDSELCGSKSQYPGLDQINIPLPKSLAGRGDVNIDVTIAGRRANVVTVTAK